MSTPPKKLYIETVGCQMNLLDSELVVASLRKEGYELTGTPADADTILFNTCSVRQHAEDKIYSALGRLKNAKQEKPGRVIGVMGCMAQKDQKLIFQRAPYVDLIVGPGQLHQVPELIRGIEQDGQQRMEVSLGRKDGKVDTIKRSHESFDPLRDPTMRPTPFQAYVRIQIGCDKFCTYCIVPSVRGPEQSRPPSQVLAEAGQLADEGCKEITLLGQTVNSWRHEEDGRRWRFSDLLTELHEVDGLERIKFVTSYPRDMTDDVLQAVRDLPKLCKYLHVPAQSGSDEQLKLMKRGYTVAEYREMHDRAKRWMPDVAITSDFIVGFSGETDADFQQTMDLVRECRFKNSFIFKYSERPGTKGADRMPDDVPDAVKRERNNELLQLQNVISEEDNQPFLGKAVQVLVEGPSRKEAIRIERSEQEGEASPGQGLQLTGRTMCDRIVVFDGNARQIGQTLPVVIYEANAHTLQGVVQTDHVGPEVFDLAGSAG
ncbi:tRNA-2-methylthio-N(6)-dimethylallyladenosine synthase [Posidoniimonas polymericola]|uniref:tRNA-2-methylthio-N(6)-dimethylallyladenosine synthase n=1 Tax=Posidoniimonas polymericola TaxID=2528002 RepID=A0A5C5ZFG4_9BACT|nr:tRNA (N6-isopentenyl adenosine(37)-C2)-methylthiotransferase MiaB [Posidoniimonas polymericola]TWT85767.1 tRNA-2-methylthio-N(6)-dimethylallyladenosine synthase [Posidoniimonas polymericola]